MTQPIHQLLAAAAAGDLGPLETREACRAAHAAVADALTACRIYDTPAVNPCTHALAARVRRALGDRP